jgi:hypothetical protein
MSITPNLKTREEIEDYFIQEKNNHIDNYLWIGINVGYNSIEVEIDAELTSIQIIQLASLLEKCDSALASIVS